MLNLGEFRQKIQILVKFAPKFTEFKPKFTHAVRFDMNLTRWIIARRFSGLRERTSADRTM